MRSTAGIIKPVPDVSGGLFWTLSRSRPRRHQPIWVKLASQRWQAGRYRYTWTASDRTFGPLPMISPGLLKILGEPA